MRSVKEIAGIVGQDSDAIFDNAHDAKLAECIRAIKKGEDPEMPGKITQKEASDLYRLLAADVFARAPSLNDGFSSNRVDRGGFVFHSILAMLRHCHIL